MSAIDRRFWWGGAALLAAGLGGCAAADPRVGAAGYGLGVLATSVNLAGLVGIVRLMGRKMADAPSERGTEVRSLVVVLVFFLKLPLFVGLGLLAWRLGGAAPTCFLVGLGLVYFFFGWALLMR